VFRNFEIEALELRIDRRSAFSKLTVSPGLPTGEQFALQIFRKLPSSRTATDHLDRLRRGVLPCVADCENVERTFSCRTHYPDSEFARKYGGFI
jgi:hypothetical protein